MCISTFFRENRVKSWLNSLLDDTYRAGAVFVENVITEDDIPDYYNRLIKTYDILIDILTEARDSIGTNIVLEEEENND